MSTTNDLAVLQAIFNPLSPYTPDDVPVCAELNAKLCSSGPVSPEVRAAVELELRGVRAAQNGALDEAVGLFTEAIRQVNSNASARAASAYNNRAQAKQLKGDSEGAMEDLDKAIELSDGQGVVASQAFCQRANLHKFFDREKEALADYTKAAALGNVFAKKALVEMNPMAALCNKMLKQIFEDLQRGEQSAKP
ncbi:hypothetical protein RvY_08992 [Ramazzottius varieornatus]|uniref:Uncharacterized protein n=1 Tax=Ramazzottius varieornatus TaxID=947166 RepID=A0A1D1VCE9_RAMVA|nr:hypothetical protein RvY_08992 [Ramazzottius varieornatus]